MFLDLFEAPGPVTLIFSDLLWNLGFVGLESGVDVRGAVPLLAEATDLYLADQIRLGVAQAEKEQFATAAIAKWCLHSLLTATLRTKGDPGSAYSRVVRVKGSVTTQQSWTRQARDRADPDTARPAGPVPRGHKAVGWSGGRRPDLGGLQWAAGRGSPNPQPVG